MLSCFAPTGGYEWNYVRDRGRLPCLPLPVGFDSVPLVRPLVATLRMVCAVTLSRAAANAVLLPKAKPRAMCEHFVVPPIRTREVARTQRSSVWHCEDALKTLDFGNGLFSVHPSQYLTERRGGQFGVASPKTATARFVRCQSIRQRPPATGTQNRRFRGVPRA